jgi:hypothetical protein
MRDKGGKNNEFEICSSLLDADYHGAYFDIHGSCLCQCK